MLAAERKNEILTILRSEGKVVVAELSKRYDVTEETIRRDLEKIEKEGFAERTYGGAVLKDNEKEEYPFFVRKRFNVAAKKRIAIKISEMIKDGEHLMLDASTTALFVAKEIRNKKKMTVITNSIEILIELADVREWKILSTGGALRAGAASLVGYQAERMVDGFHVDKAILSCKGVDLVKGFTDSNELDAGIKKEMLGAATMKIMAVDSGKFGHISFTKIVGFSEIDVVATEFEMNETWKEKMDEYRVSVLKC
jgi:DeoR/GlpR family transcriptional regulator of sugar metabolism